MDEVLAPRVAGLASSGLGAVSVPALLALRLDRAAAGSCGGGWCVAGGCSGGEAGGGRHLGGCLGGVGGVAASKEGLEPRLLVTISSSQMNSPPLLTEVTKGRVGNSAVGRIGLALVDVLELLDVEARQLPQLVDRDDCVREEGHASDVRGMTTVLTTPSES